MQIPHETYVQIVELKIVLQEKDSLENELQNTRAMVGTFDTWKEELEYQIQSLKSQV